MHMYVCLSQLHACPEALLGTSDLVARLVKRHTLTVSLFLVDCKDDRDCEEEVDRFFDEYCSSANAAATTFEQQLATVATECTPTGYSKVS